jgi:hypothetical protein
LTDSDLVLFGGDDDEAAELFDDADRADDRRRIIAEKLAELDGADRCQRRAMTPERWCAKFSGSRLNRTFAEAIQPAGLPAAAFGYRFQWPEKAERQ